MSQNQGPVVHSLLENDLYKFTMWQALLHSNPGAQAEYRFVCRNRPAFPLTALKVAVEKELDRLCSLHFTQDELDYLSSLRFIKSDFVDFLSVFRFQRRFVQVGIDADQLTVTARGPLVHVMGFEIFVLYIVNELYFRRLAQEGVMDIARERLQAKLSLLREALADSANDGGAPFIFFDFGLRRRYSGAWQEEVVRTLAQAFPQNFRGTSNVHLARTLGLTPVGTMAHEYLQAYQAFGFRLRDFQKAALEGWVQEFRGDLGVALTDVVGMDAFLRDFDLYFAKLFDGLRHDSGDPVVWGEKAIAHYKQLRIDPASKRLVFSDGLDLPRALALFQHFRGRIQTSFGIGTNLTNDTPHEALNIVMKITACNGQPVAKLSDASGKTLCEDETFLAYLRQVFNHPA
ncbi:MAG: nicotinate phosphoribosyltransferase [Candidatus Dactylopiibacterium carminicum]|uniref:Nicotinate phosphoribosyltransferase n=1 Tax=Candidatus Dactylopiibacterium carminicum TaxID=857335 RepID=A0A272ESM3_9RHOO|nr:nicotinate phosphoribosyltransferase [Candidatus Dactylopiibacterium carminicum]KAF7599054.1 nicotinate phosphoribosyltransferase [Candidatus Dactylopiibacterium carminicum]PAS93095.1 MAG: nicotinate phosphoribosyltransferase [Candidatus Dactylopiibacterium carminicum]PAS99067.1 MAG: nicotinate phosphoribosyltransferase [Candidatus Dactylopiibacterium carminicum]